MEEPLAKLQVALLDIVGQRDRRKQREGRFRMREPLAILHVALLKSVDIETAKDNDRAKIQEKRERAARDTDCG